MLRAATLIPTRPLPGFSYFYVHLPFLDRIQGSVTSITEDNLEMEGTSAYPGVLHHKSYHVSPSIPVDLPYRLSSSALLRKAV